MDKDRTNGNIDQLKFDDKNFNKHTEYGMSLLEKSLRENGAGRSILVDKDDNIIAGNGIVEAAINAGISKTRIVEVTGDELVVVKRTDLELDSKQGREMALADNATAAANLSWDEECIAAETEKWEIVPEDWGVEFPETNDETSEDEIERKAREFQERMEAGEIDETDEEYQQFLEKFKQKKTTDDCYTPTEVYDAVAKWVSDTYNIDRRHFERPFYPGGDYKNAEYPKGCVVVDNPPFSILAEILQFYTKKGIKFFLFAPSLTLFSSSSSSSSSCTALPVGVSITYENGANVATSFLTNLEPSTLRLRSCPTLYDAVKTANDNNLRKIRKELPKYSYPDYVITATRVCQFSRYGIDFAVPVSESKVINRLDSQVESGKTIYGKGYLVSERVKAEREKAEREKAEREKAERWELSQRELDIIKSLSQ